MEQTLRLSMGFKRLIHSWRYVFIITSVLAIVSLWLFCNDSQVGRYSDR